MKHFKYALFLCTALVLAVQSYAQPDTRRMNISIGIFSSSATAYDYEGAIGVVGSSGYTVDDIEPGDMFWDDRSRYRVDSVEIIVAGSSATVWVTDLYSAGAPQSGKGTLGKPSPNLGLQPLTENGSNFITEAQEAKILTDNLQRLDSLAGDGNGLISALASGSYTLDASNRTLTNNLYGINNNLTNGGTYYSTIDGGKFQLELELTQLPEPAFSFPGAYERFAIRTGEGGFFEDSDEATIQLQNTNRTNPEVFIGHHNGFLLGNPPYNGSSSLLSYNRLGGVHVDGNGITIKGEGFESGSNVLKYSNDYSSTYTDRSIPDVGYVKALVSDSVATAGDGNGIVSALPSGPVNIDANNNSLIIDSTSTTKVTAVGSAKGDLVVSGNTSLPSSLSHIAGADTAQVNVRASAGIGLTSTQNVSLTAPAIDIGRSLEVTQLLNNDFITHKGVGPGFFRILDYGDLDPVLNDPIGIEIYHTATNRRITIGDSESEYNQTKLFINDFASQADLGGYGFGFRYLNSVISIGDHNFDNNGTRFFLDDQNNYIKFGDYFGENPMLFELDNGNSNKTIKFGDISNIRSGIQMVVEDNDFNISRVVIGDANTTTNGTLLQVDNNAETITAKADNGVSITGTAYNYTLPVSTPSAADSLDRAMVWRQDTAGFKVVNDGDFRTINATGNILPYDDIIEVIQGITVHLPAPSATYQGKVYHIIAGGTVSAGTPSTIDVVDGSSTIELGASLTLDNAFEVYTLTCNGSQWIVLNNKP